MGNISNKINNEEFANEKAGISYGVNHIIATHAIKPKEEVLSINEILKQRKCVLRNVHANFKDIPSVTMCALLNYVNWDSEKLVVRLHEDRESLFEAARVSNPHSALQLQDKQDSRKPTNEDGSSECVICYTNAPLSNIREIKCGHQFCLNCWREYFRIKIKEEGRGLGITCAGHNCNVLLDTKIIMILAAPKVKAEYQLFLMKSFVECSPHLTWCPAPKCKYAIKVEESKYCAVTCKCGRSFCFACREIWHDPIDCTLFQKWLKKCTDDSETSKWINANTKECPKCKAPIEKQGGCNHMKCPEKLCRYEFCWVCLQKFGKTHSYLCNRYVEDQSKRESRKLLVHYLRYYRHYMRNYQSLKAEEKFYRTISKIKKMKSPNIALQESLFFEEVVVALRQCRETLIATYVFLYYLKKGNTHLRQIEDNLYYLEEATEDLWECLQCESTCADIELWTAVTLNKALYCRSRRFTLLDHIHEGYSNSWWQFTE